MEKIIKIFSVVAAIAIAAGFYFLYLKKPEVTPRPSFTPIVTEENGTNERIALGMPIHDPDFLASIKFS